MPLWRIFSNPDTFSPTQRAAFAKDITDYYIDKGLPPFYVNVFFIPLEPDNFFIGGTPRKNFVRITIEHIARHYPDGDTEAGMKFREGRMDLINEVGCNLSTLVTNIMDWWNGMQVLKPHIADRGDLEWEHNIAETPRDLWRVHGLVAPPADSEGDKMWKEAGKAVPYTL
jgi:phenylpyruvate tautomerase PptA (4-oxalocrotonate tautomerase family)